MGAGWSNFWGSWNFSEQIQISSPNIWVGYFAQMEQNGLPKLQLRQDAAVRAAAEECRSLRICKSSTFLPQIFGWVILLKWIKIASSNSSCAQDSELSQKSAGVCASALPCAFDKFLQPVLLDSASPSCCWTFPSNFCATMPEQLCSNPWRSSFVRVNTWDHPSKMTQNGPKIWCGGV